MKVRFTKIHQTSLDGINTVEFAEGEVVELSAEHAERHIASGAAVEHKAIEAAPENKALKAPEKKNAGFSKRK